MQSVQNKMNNKLDDKLLIVQDLAVTKKQVTDELKQDNDEFTKKLIRNDSDLDKINTLLIRVLSQKQTYLTCNRDLTKSRDPTTVVPYNNKNPPLKGGHYTIIGGIWLSNMR